MITNTTGSAGRWAGYTAAAAALALASSVALTAAAGTASASSISVSDSPDATMMAGATSSPELVKEFNAWINSFLFSEGTIKAARDAMGAKAAHYFLTYVRNFLGGSILYYITAAMWHWVIYIKMGRTLFPKGMPAPAVIWDQIQLAQLSTTVYAMLPVLGEFFIEEGYTRCYFHFSDVGGLIGYVLYTVVYLTFVEIGIYWMHRTLHTNKFLYKYVHALHHKYNSPETLSPWASIAFNPLDGVLQACPYVICLFFIPCHYYTHMAMFMFTAIWATNIHDAVPGNSEPIMGAKYHTVHHTHYHVNFGQFFTFCDQYWGTLKRPQDMRGYQEPSTDAAKKAS
ncbi:unnamed protein product [Ectocarpus sp. 6 AP-2014]